MDNGYQEAAEMIRALHPSKKPPRGRLTAAHVSVNADNASDKIVVEKYFGRICSLWAILSQKYRWSEGSYYMIFRFCLSVTNYHISVHNLHKDVSLHYALVRNRPYGISASMARKHASQ